MKAVLLSQRVVQDSEHGERRDALDQRWPAFLRTCGYAAVPVPNVSGLPEALFELLRPAGVVLTGGGDLVRYGGDAPERDEVETELLAAARRKSVPVLGVCRGLLVIQTSFGGLIDRVAGHVAVRHSLRGASGRVEVNSFHNWGVLVPAPNLEATAVASDGVVEALDAVYEPIRAVMWHPEREAPSDPADISLVRSLFQ